MKTKGEANTASMAFWAIDVSSPFGQFLLFLQDFFKEIKDGCHRRLSLMDFTPLKRYYYRDHYYYYFLNYYY